MGAGKRCYKCSDTKSVSEFYRDQKSKDGLQSKCKPCSVSSASAWNRSNKERCNESNRRARRNSPEKHREFERKRHKRDREKRLEAMRSYAARHPQAIAANHDRRRARVFAAPGSHTEGERVALFESYAWKCAYCTNDATDLDHITALARGGCNHAMNLVPSCNRCNRSKGTKTLLEFLVRRAS